MNTNQANGAAPKQEKLSALEQRLFCHDPGSGILHTYYNAAIETRKYNRAKKTFEQLQRHFPGNQNIRSLYIATCLQQNDFSAAMDAIETLVAFSKPDDGLIETSLSVRSKIGPRKINQSRSGGTTIAVCMVVKNEQACIGPCLNAVKTIADEIIVIDTGSEDRTADIARIFGARVFSFEWQDDFSAARNCSLEKVRSNWVLILDADEIIAAKDLIVLKNIIHSHKDQLIGISIETRNYTNVANALHWQPNEGQYPQQEAGLGWFPSRKIRLFPRTDKIYFHYPIHELVEPSIKAAGIAIAKSDIPIHHYGHLNETKNKIKAQAYFKIGYAKIEQIGHNVTALRELAVQAGQLEYWSEALDLWRRLIQIKPDFTEAYVNMAGACWQVKEYAHALKYAQQALRFDPVLKEAHFNAAISQLMLGRADEAAVILSQLVVKHDQYLAAKFMWGVSCCVLEDESCSRDIFLNLTQSAAGRALTIAMKNLIQRFREAGLNRYAALLTQSSVLLRQTGITCKG